MTEKYFLVTARYGLIGKNCLLSITFPVISASRKEALKLANCIPFIKDNPREAVVIIEVKFAEYLKHKIDSAFVPYFKCTDITGKRNLSADSIVAMDAMADYEYYRQKMELEEAKAEIARLGKLIRTDVDIPIGEFNMFEKNAKILLLGGGEKLSDSRMKITLNKLCMPKDCIEWHKYEDLKSFNISVVMHSMKYSDIIIGHSPHNTKGIGNSNSMACYLRDHQEDIPGQIQLLSRPNRTGLDDLTQTSFRNKVEKSLLFKTVHNIIPIEKRNDFGEIAV